MRIESIRLRSLLNAPLRQFDPFFAQAAFVISHKDEPVKTLLGVLAFLPAQSAVIIVSNCPVGDFAQLKQKVAVSTVGREVFLVHQKDPLLAAILRDRGVLNILDNDGLVHSGKGEGMYCGTLCAMLLARQPRSVIYYDADNRAPSALLEYSLAMAQLFGEAEETRGIRPEDALHNIRVCWSSKPDLRNGWSEDEDMNPLGRCTREVSPLVHQLLAHWFPGFQFLIISSNAGEAGLSIAAARGLPFSSGFSVETFLLLGLLQQALEQGAQVLFQQYLAISPHIHEKGDMEHILRMIAESFGCFAAFPRIIPLEVMGQVEPVCTRVGITSLITPRVYPALGSPGLQAEPSLLYQHYKLFPSPGEQVGGFEGVAAVAE